jgi:hypothetical protein
MALSNEALEKIILYKWSHAAKGRNKICQIFFINVQLVNRLQIPTKNIQITQVEGKNVQIFKYLKVSMDKYVLHSYFYVIDID